ncbi:hypothetical protein BH09VER1_BH09VER1_50520 [soil metagenome]
MKLNPDLTWRQAFIVLVVLFILAAAFVSLSVSADSGPGGSRQSMAKNDLTQIATAVNAFVTEYGGLPSTNRGDVSGELLATLTGHNHRINPRDLVFLEVEPVKRGYSGLTNGTFVDPWGGPYQIAFDSGYINCITNAGTNAATVVKKTVAVWSDPNRDPDAASLSEAKKSRRYINSWE